jgi:hypothetical protein
VTVTITGCGSDGNGNPMTPTPPAGGVTGEIAANHGHDNATISNAQLTAGNAVELDIRGSADHPHTVSLSMQEVMQVAAGQRVDKTSTNDASVSFGAHAHTVSFN